MSLINNSRICQLVFTCVLGFASAASADQLPSNGDMEYGDGGWYLWQAPKDGGSVDWKAGVADIGYQGSKGAFIDVHKTAKENWGMQFQAPKWLADSGVVYEFSFMAKSDKVGTPLTAIVQGGPPNYDTKDGFDVKLDTAWKEFKFTFFSTQKGFGTSSLNFYLTHVGKYWIDEVKATPLDMALDTGWYGRAEVRIDSIRKKDFHIQVKQGGKILPSAQVRVDLEQHAFPFGTAIALSSNRDSMELWYRKAVEKYFWSIVPENQFKWPDYEHSKGSPNRDAIKEYTDLAAKNHWTLRGHNMVWGIQGFGFDKHWSIQGSCEEIAQNIHARIDRDLKEYKGKMTEYDVWNEPFHEPFLFDKCGWQLMDSAFVWAHRADPTAVLYINEYDVVEAGRTETYYNLIRGMLDRKIPVQGVGVQCHFQNRRVIPALIKMRLDRLAELGLPLKVTEFDLGSMNGGMTLPEVEQGHQFADFFRTVFSHPAVNGIMLWGFWDSKHWIQNGGMIAADGRAKPAADTTYALWHEHWTTHASATLDAQGTASFHGFPGVYKVTVKQGAQTWIVDAEITDANKPKVIELP